MGSSRVRDEQADDPAIVEAEWNEEILRRVDELRTGKVKGIPADVVLAHLREKQARRSEKK